MKSKFPAVSLATTLISPIPLTMSQNRPIPLTTTKTSHDNSSLSRYIGRLSALVFTVVLNFYAIIKFINSLSLSIYIYIYTLKLSIPVLPAYSAILFPDPHSPGRGCVSRGDDGNNNNNLGGTEHDILIGN